MQQKGRLSRRERSTRADLPDGDKNNLPAGKRKGVILFQARWVSLVLD